MTHFSISMTTKFLASALLSIFSIASTAPGALAATVNSSAQNTQSNSGTVNLAPMGGSNSNYQINSVSNSQHMFGPGIACPTPELGIGAFGGNDNAYGGGHSNGATNFGATIMFTTPIGGQVGESCRELVAEITRQRQLDTSAALIRQCAEFARAGVMIDVEQFPEFKVCSAVTVNGRTALDNP